jgi:hypothetical protein
LSVMEPFLTHLKERKYMMLVKVFPSGRILCS